MRISTIEGLRRNQMIYRIGQGYDAHRLKAGRPLVLGGVTIPAEKGLDGHSDADVLCHAMADAILGALSEGDIGRHFPPGDPEWKDVSSLVLLERVAAIARSRSAVIVNIDSTLILEEPKIAPYVSAMKKEVGRVLGISPDAVSVKATTNEGLGSIGRSEGAAAHAVALIQIEESS